MRLRWGSPRVSRVLPVELDTDVHRWGRVAMENSLCKAHACSGELHREISLSAWLGWGCSSGISSCKQVFSDFSAPGFVHAYVWTVSPGPSWLFDAGSLQVALGGLNLWFSYLSLLSTWDYRPAPAGIALRGRKRELGPGNSNRKETGYWSWWRSRRHTAYGASY